MLHRLVELNKVDIIRTYLLKKTYVTRPHHACLHDLVGLNANIGLLLTQVSIKLKGDA